MPKKKAEKIIVFDTTLRDGEQSPGASMNINEKLDVARILQALKVDVIEAGFPISSPGDFESVKRVAQEIKGPIIAGLARAQDKDIDRCWEAVKHSKKPRIHTFIATSDVHVEKKLRKSRQEVVDIAVKAVARAKNYCDDVEFSCEDSARTDKKYICEVIEAVISAGAKTVNVPDTVGYSNPWEFGDLIRYIFENVPNVKDAVISVHCHNDLGLAVANSLAAVREGARQVECCINGIGERAGNASLEEFVMNVNTRKNFFGFRTDINTKYLYKASRLVSNITGIPVQPNKAIVGGNAFAHEAGIHQDGVLKERTTYEIMLPEDVGWKGTSMVMGKHSGRHAFKQRLIALGYNLNDELMQQAFERFKVVADKKKDIYDEDLEAIVEEISDVSETPEVYRLEYVQTTSGTTTAPTATVKLYKGEKSLEGAGCGDGPIDAAFQTIQRLTKTKSKLANYQLKAITGGTDAMGEVVVMIEEKGLVVNGRATSTDIIVASVKAYINALNKMEMRLAKGKSKPSLKP